MKGRVRIKSHFAYQIRTTHIIVAEIRRKKIVSLSEQELEKSFNVKTLTSP